MQNLGGEAQGQGALDPKDEAPWYMKYGVRGLGTVAGGLAMLLGAIDACLNLITLAPICAIFNIWQVVVGFGVLTIESPCCCFFVDHVQAITARVEGKPLWMKAALFVAAPLPCIIFCFGFYTMFGSGLIVITGIMYGFMALGKKASREEMARNAQSQPTGILPFRASSTTDKAYLVENLRDPAPAAPSPAQTNGYQSGFPSKMGDAPPSYTDLQEPPVGWHTPFKPTTTTTSISNNYSPSASVTMGSSGLTDINPVPSNPYNNPFQ